MMMMMVKMMILKDDDSDEIELPVAFITSTYKREGQTYKGEA